MMKKAKSNGTKAEYKDIFDELAKLNPDSSILSQSPLSVVDNWIDTGNYALNAIMSGSVYGGAPQGRITGFSGPPACGKTLIINKIIGNAQKKLDQFAVIWDSEVAVDEASAKSVGCDTSRIRHMPVESIEECRNQISKFLDRLLANKQEGKFIIAIDSIGNLASQKELDDAAAGKTAVDMGLRAKAIKSMMRTLTYKCAKSKTALLFSNHVYDDPAAMFPSLVKNQGGGKGPSYLASLLIQLSHKTQKAEKGHEGEEQVARAERIGATLNAMTVKNRFVPPFLRTDMYLNFRTGLDKYSGLLELCLDYGIILSNGPTYKLANGESIGYLKSFRNDTKFWDDLLPKLDEVLAKEFKYSSDQIIEKEELTDDTE